MNLFGKRPLALFCASFALASVLGCYLTLQRIRLHLPLTVLLFLIAALLLAVPLLLHRFHPKLLTPIIAFLFAALSLIQSQCVIGNKLSKLAPFDGQEVSCRLLIKEKAFALSYLSCYRAEIETLDGTPLNAMAEVTLPFYAEWEVGDVILGDFSLHSVNDGSENTLYRLADQILLELEGEAQGYSVVDRVKPDILAVAISDFRELLSERIGNLIDGEEGNLVSSLFLNKRELLEDRTTLAFRRTGTTHLLAISGMHLSILILLVEKLLCALGVSKRTRCITVLLVTFFYLALTGFALSACRAFLMCCFVYLSWLFRSDNDPITSLFFSLFLILVISPYSVCDIGMWMSVLAVLGILITVELLEAVREALKKRKRMSPKAIRLIMSTLSSVALSLAAEIFILFPMWLAFDELSLVALPCGLILSPLVTVVLFLTPVMLLFSWLPLIAAPLGALLCAVCRVMLEAVSYFSSFRGITVSLGYRFFDYLIPISSILIALLLIIKLKRKWLLSLAMGGTVLSIGIFISVLRLPAADSLTADFLSQKENELLLFSYAEQSVICDSSTGAYSPLRSAYDLLRARNTTEISAYVLTHYHTLHVSTLSRLFSAFAVRAVYLPLPQTEKESAVLTSLLALVKENGITAHIYDRGKPLALGPLSLTVSNEAYLKRSTQPTFYIKASAFGQELLYIGESAHEDQALYRALCEQTKNAELVIFGSHGPITKQSFSSPLGEGYTFLSDESLLPFFSPESKPTGKIVCGSTQISLTVQKDDKN